jgi:aminoglycoside phosphotransferase (APT) family kinase protein
MDTEAAITEWETALKLIAWNKPPVWIHGDLMPGNMLLSNGNLDTILDFGCLGIGDPASDMIPAWNLLPATARDIYHEALYVDNATWARGRGWAFSMALIQLPYYEHTNIAMADNARHVISEVLSSD